MYQEKIEAIRIAPKHNNSLETSKYAIQKHHAIHQSEAEKHGSLNSTCYKIKIMTINYSVFIKIKTTDQTSHSNR